MKKSALYTCSGDRGTTALVSGNRVDKHHIRIHTYGTVDELNSFLGLLDTYPLPEGIHPIILSIQMQLFDLGAYLATDPTHPTQYTTPQPPTAAQVEALERSIDAVDSRLPRLSSFVIPGGTRQAAIAHIARTVCRRAERHATELNTLHPLDPTALKYLNRLSDLLFAIARLCNIDTRQPEIFWQKDCSIE